MDVIDEPPDPGILIVPGDRPRLLADHLPHPLLVHPHRPEVAEGTVLVEAGVRTKQNAIAGIDVTAVTTSCLPRPTLQQIERFAVARLFDFEAVFDFLALIPYSLGMDTATREGLHLAEAPRHRFLQGLLAAPVVHEEKVPMNGVLPVHLDRPMASQSSRLKAFHEFPEVSVDQLGMSWGIEVDVHEVRESAAQHPVVAEDCLQALPGGAEEPLEATRVTLGTMERRRSNRWTGLK